MFRVSVRPAVITILFLCSLLALCACVAEYNPPVETGAASPAAVTPTATETHPTATVKVTETPEPVPSESIDIQANQLDGEQVVFWHPWAGKSGETVEEMIAEFNVSNGWGIEVETVFAGSPDSIDQKVWEAIDADELPAVVVGYLHQAQEWNEQTPVIDLEVFVDDPVWGFVEEERADFHTVFWEHDLVGGVRFGLPVQRSGQVLLYNTSWARELGLDSGPETPEDFKEQACTAYYANLLDEVDENDGSGGWIVSTDYSTTLGWIFAFEGGLVNSAGSNEDGRVYDFDKPENEAAFRFLRDLFDDGCAWLPESQVTENEFASRQGLFTSAHVGDLDYIREAFRAQGNSDTWTAIPYPSPGSMPAFDVFGPSLIMLPSTPEKQLASWLFMKWLTGPEQQAKLVEATGTMPVRVSSIEYLEDYKTRNPQWSQAVSALAFAQSEPQYPSWKNVRWALSDATRQLFLSYFTIENVPELLDFLDQTAHELHLGPVKSGLLDTPTFTPTITPTASQTPTITNTLRVTATAAAVSQTPEPSPSQTYTPAVSPTR